MRKFLLITAIIALMSSSLFAGRVHQINLRVAIVNSPTNDIQDLFSPFALSMEKNPSLPNPGLTYQFRPSQNFGIGAGFGMTGKKYTIKDITGESITFEYYGLEPTLSADLILPINESFEFSVNAAVGYCWLTESTMTSTLNSLVTDFEGGAVSSRIGATVSWYQDLFRYSVEGGYKACTVNSYTYSNTYSGGTFKGINGNDAYLDLGGLYFGFGIGVAFGD